MTGFVTLYVTCPNRAEARDLAYSLLQERLIACANITEGTVSLYRWGGDLQEESETIMIAKTDEAHRDAAMARMRQLHSYECPCIVAWPIVAIDGDYSAWLSAQLA